MKKILITLLLAACGDNTPPTPDAPAPDDTTDPACTAPVYEAAPCHPTLPGAFCTKTFVVDGDRGCCIEGQFYNCGAP